jgi:hypothetical protein
MESYIETAREWLIGYGPRVLAAFIIFIVGWTAAKIVSGVLRRGLGGAVRRTAPIRTRPFPRRRSPPARERAAVCTPTTSGRPQRRRKAHPVKPNFMRFRRGWLRSGATAALGLVSSRAYAHLRVR